MSRNEVVRGEVHATVSGFELENGEMVPRAYTYERTWPSTESMEKFVRKHKPNFIPTEWSEHRVKYTMPLATFRELAEMTVTEQD